MRFNKNKITPSENFKESRRFTIEKLSIDIHGRISDKYKESYNKKFNSNKYSDSSNNSENTQNNSNNCNYDAKHVSKSKHNADNLINGAWNSISDKYHWDYPVQESNEEYVSPIKDIKAKHYNFSEDFDNNNENTEKGGSVLKVVDNKVSEIDSSDYSNRPTAKTLYQNTDIIDNYGLTNRKQTAEDVAIEAKFDPKDDYASDHIVPSSENELFNFDNNCNSHQIDAVENSNTKQQLKDQLDCEIENKDFNNSDFENVDSKVKNRVVQENNNLDSVIVSKNEENVDSNLPADYSFDGNNERASDDEIKANLPNENACTEVIKGYILDNEKEKSKVEAKTGISEKEENKHPDIIKPTVIENAIKNTHIICANEQAVEDVNSIVEDIDSAFDKKLKKKNNSLKKISDKFSINNTITKFDTKRKKKNNLNKFDNAQSKSSKNKKSKLHILDNKDAILQEIKSEKKTLKKYRQKHKTENCQISILKRIKNINWIKLGKKSWRIAILAVLGFIIGIELFAFNAKVLLREKIPMVGGYGMSVVISGSMSPSINVNDLIIVAECDSYKEGDIVVYVNDNDNLVTHRIIKFLGDQEFIPKGDANNAPDDTVSTSRIKGKVVNVIPFVGMIFNDFVKYLFLVIIIALLIISLYQEVQMRKVDKARTDDIKNQIEELRRLRAFYEQNTNVKNPTDNEGNFIMQNINNNQK